MAAELLVIGNPSKRRRKGTRKSRVRRNPAKRRPMTAAQAKYFGPKRKRRKTGRRRRTAALAVSRNSVKRRSVRRRHVRRNQISLNGFKPKHFVNDTLVPAGIGAAGALAMDVVMGYAAPHLPAAFTTGTIAPTATKLAGAVGLGMAINAVTKDRHMAEAVTAGAIIVTLYGTIKKFAAAQFPTVPGLAGMGVYVHGMGYAGAARAFPDPRAGMGVYVASGQPMAMMAPPRSANQAPVGLHGGEMSEGGYNY